MNEKTNFLNNLNFLLKTNHISRSKLARDIGLAPSTVNSWFYRDKTNASIPVVHAIAAYFNVPSDMLVNGNVETDLEIYEKQLFNDARREKLKLTFSAPEYTEKELRAIENFAQFLKDNRGI